MPTSATDNPDLVLQPSMYKNGDGVDVAYADNRLYINNYNGNDVLVYETVPASVNQLPDFALGSPDIQAQTLDSIFYTQNPVPVTDGQRLIVTSDFDRAIYIWDQFPTQSGQPYDHKIPMPPNVHLWATALHNHQMVAGARNALFVWNNTDQLSATPSHIFPDHIGSAQFDEIRGVALDDQFLYVATKSGKIYLWNGIPTDAAQEPVLTLNSTAGQFGFLYSDGEYLCAARPEPPTGADIYRVSDLAAGLTTPFKVISSGNMHLNQVSQAATFGGALAVACRGDHRVVLWKEVADWGDPAKMVILGQSADNQYEAAIGVDRLFMPSTLLPFDNALWVGEFKFSSRLLKFSYDATAAPAPENLASAVRLYPNPFSEMVRIELSVEQSGFYKLELLDQTGRLLGSLFQGNAAAGTVLSQSLSAPGLPGGIYFLKISGPGGRSVLKLLKQ